MTHYHGMDDDESFRNASTSMAYASGLASLPLPASLPSTSPNLLSTSNANIKPEIEQKQERVEIKDPNATPQLSSSTTPPVHDHILLQMSTLLTEPAKRMEFLQQAKGSDDETAWTTYGAQLPQDVLELFILQTFRSRLQVAHIDSRDDKCLRWLCKLYMGYLPNDDQVRNLPYQVIPQNTTHQNVSYIWGHLRGLTDTLLEMRDFYHAGYVHLLSRRESQHELHAPGQYLFRMSNLEVGTIIISTTSYHLYLSTDRYAQAGFGPFPSNIHINTIRRRYVGKDFVISQWTVPMIQKLLAQESKRLGLVTPMMGAVAMSQLNNVYSSKVQSEYDHLQRDEARYIYAPDASRPQTRYDQPMQSLQDFTNPPVSPSVNAPANPWGARVGPSVSPQPAALPISPDQLFASMTPEQRQYWSMMMMMSMNPMAIPGMMSPMMPGMAGMQMANMSMAGMPMAGMPMANMAPMPSMMQHPMQMQNLAMMQPPLARQTSPPASSTGVYGSVHPQAQSPSPVVDKSGQPSAVPSEQSSEAPDSRVLEETFKSFQSNMRDHFQPNPMNLQPSANPMMPPMMPMMMPSQPMMMNPMNPMTPQQQQQLFLQSMMGMFPQQQQQQQPPK